MKNTFFGLIAFCLGFSTLVQAAPSQDVRLQLQNVPNSPAIGGKFATISVYSDGLVVESFSSPLPMPIPSVIVKQLGGSEMQEIEQLIAESRDGKITTTTTPFHCMAMAMSYDLYTADNRQIFLKRSALCQDPTFNETASAAKLVEILGNLRQEASTVSN